MNNDIMREFGSNINWQLIDQVSKEAFVEYIKDDHAKKTFMLFYDSVDVPLEALDNILSYL